MTTIAGYELKRGHVLEYDPRRDIDRIRDHAITRCGKRLHGDRLSHEWIGLCRSCLRLTAVVESADRRVLGSTVSLQPPDWR